MRKIQIKRIKLLLFLFLVLFVGAFFACSYIFFYCTLTSRSVPNEDFQSVLNEVMVESGSKLILNSKEMVDLESIPFCLRSNINLTRYLEKSEARYQRNDYQIIYHLGNIDAETELRIQVIDGSVCAINIASLDSPDMSKNIKKMLLSKLPRYLDIKATF